MIVENKKTPDDRKTDVAIESADLLGWRKCKVEGKWEWRLYRGDNYYASVWLNGTWFTWDEDGVGGENSIEYSTEKAKLEATVSVIRQGFLS